MYNHVKPCVLLLRLGLTPRPHTITCWNVVDLVVVCMYVTRLIIDNCRILRRRRGICDRPDRLSDRPPKDRQGLQLVSSMAKRFIILWPTTYLSRGIRYCHQSLPLRRTHPKLRATEHRALYVKFETF